MRPFLIAAVLATGLVAGWGCSKKPAPPPPQTAPPANQPETPETPQAEAAVLGPELSKVPDASIRRIESKTSQSPHFGAENGRFIAERATLTDALLKVCRDRLVESSPGLLPEGIYNISFKGGSEDEARANLMGAIEKSFGLKIVHEERVAEVLVLTASPERPPALVPANEDFGSGMAHDNNSGVVDFTGVSMNGLCHHLTTHSGKLVLDETGLKGKYSFSLELPWRLSPEQATVALKKVGLDLSKARRRVDAWFVEKAPQDAAPADKPLTPEKTPAAEKAPATTVP